MERRKTQGKVGLVDHGQMKGYSSNYTRKVLRSIE
jgi:hypothetical protein